MYLSGPSAVRAWGLVLRLSVTPPFIPDPSLATIVTLHLLTWTQLSGLAARHGVRGAARVSQSASPAPPTERERERQDERQPERVNLFLRGTVRAIEKVAFF